ncbi:MAG TPA: hypothetical protein VEB59_11350 [Gemmatimonadales bacterium]|nr:hypothetical protein [Gemmatimonadales bacterium]
MALLLRKLCRGCSARYETLVEKGVDYGPNGDGVLGCPACASVDAETLVAPVEHTGLRGYPYWDETLQATVHNDAERRRLAAERGLVPLWTQDDLTEIDRRQRDRRNALEQEERERAERMARRAARPEAREFQAMVDRGWLTDKMREIRSHVEE